MSNPYLGEIRIFAGNFAPSGWAFCEGQLMSIADNDALFALIGTTYGGDGTTTFALPNLSSRLAVHSGGSNSYVQGQTGGQESVTLVSNQIPSHTHTLQAQSAVGTSTSPANAVFAASGEGQYAPSSGVSATLSPVAVAQAGENLAHDNRIPYVSMSYIISLFGIFPSRN